MTDLLQELKALRKKILYSSKEWEPAEDREHAAELHGFDGGLKCAITEIDALIQRAEAEQTDISLPYETVWGLLEEGGGEQPSHQEALDAIEVLISDTDLPEFGQSRAEERKALATIRAALQRPRVPDGWQVYRHNGSIIVDGGPGIGAMLTPDSGQARLDTLYQFLDAMLAAAPDQQEDS